MSPNPFANRLAFHFELKAPAAVRINLYDNKGALVRQVFNGNKSAGRQQVEINTNGWNSGIYYGEFVINEHRIMRKLILEKF